MERRSLDFAQYNRTIARAYHAPKTWCDVHDNSPRQGVNLEIDALDITTVVGAFKGSNYPYSGPSAPFLCP